jgi:hypothetical protein
MSNLIAAIRKIIKLITKIISVVVKLVLRLVYNANMSIPSKEQPARKIKPLPMPRKNPPNIATKTLSLVIKCG